MSENLILSSFFSTAQKTRLNPQSLPLDLWTHQLEFRTHSPRTSRLGTTRKMLKFSVALILETFVLLTGAVTADVTYEDDGVEFIDEDGGYADNGGGYETYAAGDGDAQELQRKATEIANQLASIPLSMLFERFWTATDLPYSALENTLHYVDPELIPTRVNREGFRMLWGGMAAGVAARVFEVDVVSHGLAAARVEKTCMDTAACELGAYLLHHNKAIGPSLVSIFEALFRDTAEHWPAMREGLMGAVCHMEYPTCDRSFLMSR